MNSSWIISFQKIPLTPVALFSLCETTSINSVLNKWFRVRHTHSASYTQLWIKHTHWMGNIELQIVARGLSCSKGAPILMGSISWSTACAPFLLKTVSFHISVKLLKQALNIPSHHQVICNKSTGFKTVSRFCTNTILVTGIQLDVGNWAGLSFTANSVYPDLFTLQGT